MPYLNPKSSQKIFGQKPAPGFAARKRIGGEPSLFGSRPYVGRPKLDVWLGKQLKKPGALKTYKALPNESREQRIKRLEKNLFGEIRGKYGFYIEKNRPRPVSELATREKELKQELRFGKVKGDPGLKKQKEFDLSLIEKLKK